MRRPFVHCAELVLEAGADHRAPGGAVTIALCGSWDRAGACRWPHHTSMEWADHCGRVRVVFVADAEDENQVRDLIQGALADGRCVGPDGRLSQWLLRGSGAGALNESEDDWAEKMGG